MSTKEDGGPAFPQKEPLTSDHQGVSLRDYFIAHAPAEPQPWFEPVVDPSFDVLPEPDAPVLVSQKASEEHDAFLADELEAVDIKDKIVRDYALAFDAHVASEERWEAEHAKQRYIQWPAAWADEMLKARKA